MRSGLAAASADVPSHVRNDPAGRAAFFAETARDLLAQGKFRGRQAILALPAAQMYIQHLRIPRLDDEATRKQRVIAQYVRWFGPEAANPDEYVDLSWDAQPLHRGCPVAIPSPGALVGFGKALRRPEGRLHFASTETAVKWSGYMDGAIRAGEAVAAEVQAAL